MAELAEVRDPKAVLEILFWMHPKGLSEGRLIKELKLSKKALLALLEDWQKDLQAQQRAFLLEKKDKEWILSPKKEYSAYVGVKVKSKKIPLGQREIIALLYYEGNLTKNSLDERRGKNSQKALKNLLAEGLIEVKEQGYCLSEVCLETFNLRKE